MDKNIKGYIHLYLGCQIRMFSEITNKWSDWRKLTSTDLNLVLNYDKKVELLLRPISDMIEPELVNVIQLTTPDYLEDKPTAEDYDLDIFYNDGGNMVDADVVIGANFTCICYEGQIAIRKCGTVHFYDEGGDAESAYNMPKVYAYLISKHFDLFGLIESGLAIDKTKTLQTT